MTDPSKEDVRALIHAQAEQEVEKTYGAPVSPDWVAAWMDEFGRLGAQDKRARTCAHNFGRYSLTRAKAEALHFLKGEDVDLTREPKERHLTDFLEPPKASYRKPMTPTAEALVAYLLADPDEPFLLEGSEYGSRFAGMKYLGGNVVLAPMSKLLPFVVWNFETSYFVHQDGSKRQVYLTSRELAAVSIVLDPKSISIQPNDLKNDKAPKEFLNYRANEIRQARERVGLLKRKAPDIWPDVFRVHARPERWRPVLLPKVGEELLPWPEKALSTTTWDIDKYPKK